MIDLIRQQYPNADIRGVANSRGINKYLDRFPEGPHLLVLDLDLKEGRGGFEGQEKPSGGGISPRPPALGLV